MEFYHKDDGYPMSISIETMSVDKMDDDTCLYESVVMDMDTNKVIGEFCHDSLLGRRKWAEGFFAGMNAKKLKPEPKTRLALGILSSLVVIVIFIALQQIFDINATWFGWLGGGLTMIVYFLT